MRPRVLKKEMVEVLRLIAGAKSLAEAHELAGEILDRQKKATSYAWKNCNNCGVTFNHRKGQYCSDACGSIDLARRFAFQRHVWEMRESGMTFTEIGRREKITANAASYAYTAFIRKMRHPSRRKEAEKMGIRFHY